MKEMLDSKPKGLKFARRFTKEGTSPFDQFEYELRESVIKNPSGEKIFEMNDVEVPKNWSQIATDISPEIFQEGWSATEGRNDREGKINKRSSPQDGELLEIVGNEIWLF